MTWLAGKLGPAERRAMREIVQDAAVVKVDGQEYLVSPVSEATVDALAAFEAEGEDRENDLEDEPQTDDEPSIGVTFGGVDLELDTSDDEPDHDNEYDYRSGTPI